MPKAKKEAVAKPQRPDVIEFSLYGGKITGKFFEGSHQYWINGKRKTGVTTYIGIMDKSRPLMIWATGLCRDALLGLIDAKQTIDQDAIVKASNLYDEKKDEAASIGTEVHNWIEAYIKGENPGMPDTKEAQIGVNAFLDWVSANKVKFLSSERVVYSKKHDFIGKMDIEARVNGKLALIDIKTSNDLYNTYRMQTAAYVKADEEESGRQYKERWLLRVAKETEKDYIKRMTEKNDMRERLGKTPQEIKDYQVFEALNLDKEPENMDYDYQGFLHAKGLFEWNKKTDFFTNGK